MEIRISIDDYSKNNLKTARLIGKYNLKEFTTFYIAPLNKEGLKQIKDLHCKGFKIGSHTVNHKRLSYLPMKDQDHEIFESKLIIQNEIGCEVESFCPPRGWYTKETIELVKNAGYKEIRTMKQGQTEEQKEFVKHITNHLYPNKQYIFNKDQKYMHLVLHSWEIDKYNMWGLLEEKLKQIYDYKNTRNK